ncbi:hydrogenase maturation protein HypF [Pseudobutyrivibrio sp. YE44]|uniref:carbamoyltransferase HypF n=1 Tax=Pseudobutyrivibrio sp. YE44 TaxID=1520802 RepID=UPI0008878A3A|nr:carbamoyltransferase HypF [Pseudobutyrivibrio sp. YE44]SDB49554.1 hydrogenase maturation protein HypF [Pseudobutyrivibrio sp. YE44]
MTNKYVIKGLVQGIGYRPFVARIAEELKLDGWVRNTGGIVTVMASGSEEALQQFFQVLSNQVPTGGFVSAIDVDELSSPTEFAPGFYILESDFDEASNLPMLPADIATCDSCKEELFESRNRRFLHPFISCTICGPRYSILKNLPYDRDTITMEDFEMCPQCRAEYTGKKDRRRHAQTVACKDCGPKLEFIRIKDKNTDNVTTCGKVDNSVDIYNENDLGPELSRACEILKDGGILAIKDIGGYHLACNPFAERSVSALRILKHREAKAFAVMFEKLEQIRGYCQVNQQEAELLESPARPIVLVRRKKVGGDSLDAVCLNSPDIGAMLPCNPVQIILTRICGPLVMTSGNASGDVLEIDNDRMRLWLEGRVASGDIPEEIQIAMLGHNRAILRPSDDSVMKVVKGRQQFIRRGRGHVPSPLTTDIMDEIFAAGGDLKSSFCYVQNGYAYVSQYLGDMETVSCQNFYEKERTAMKDIFGFNPKYIAADLHPGYFSRNMAKELSEDLNLPISCYQHHKSHVAAVIAEHRLSEPVLGFAFDGTGYGEDGNIWGSEAFIWRGTSNMERVAHLKPLKLIGGDEGAKNCDTILSGFLHSIGLEAFDINPNKELIYAAIDNNINTVTSTSMGRLFDAVSAMLDICHYNSYEGQAPVELENIAARNNGEAYALSLGEDGDVAELFAGIAEAMKNQIPREKIAKGFIQAVGKYIQAIALKSGITTIVLSGGTFLNRILLEYTIDLLESEGFTVYISNQLPSGDGSICLGQAFLAYMEK